MRIKIIVLIIIMLPLTACALSMTPQEEADFAWELFCRENPECNNAKKPKVVFLKMAIYVHGVKSRGYYCPNSNTVYLTKDADMSTLIHEYNHACGKQMQETPVNAYGFR